MKCDWVVHIEMPLIWPMCGLMVVLAVLFTSYSLGVMHERYQWTHGRRNKGNRP